MGKRLFTLLSNRVFFLLLLLVIVVLIMSLISPYFFDLNNMITMTRFGAALALIGLGQSLVILGGGAGIDLSVGSIMSLSGVIFGLMVGVGINDWMAAIITIFVGGMLGSLNGITIALLGLPPLIGTLGTLYAYGAIALVITKGVPLSGFSESFSFLANGKVLGVPTQILLIVIPVFVILQIMMTKTNFGRSIYLVGINEVAAQFSGIQVKRVRFILYTISGLLAGMGAIIMSSWFMASRPDVGNGMEMRAITVAVLGGIDIFGGVGSLVGTILSVIIVTMIASGLQLANINTIWQLAILGFILLGAVALNQVFVKKII
ncbi:MAG: ABC transporter permease [Proteobacteria bacterium]|nr:ABC transporter permease [Pseudomonadota bacterium]